MNILWIRRSDVLTKGFNPFEKNKIQITTVRSYGRFFFYFAQKRPNLVVVETSPRDPLFAKFYKAYRGWAAEVPILCVMEAPVKLHFFWLRKFPSLKQIWNVHCLESFHYAVIEHLNKGNRSISSRYHDVELLTASHEVKRAGQHIFVTRIQFQILQTLLEKQEKIVSQSELIRALWPNQFALEGMENRIHVHFANLRAKIDQPFPEKLIHTVRGKGFILKRQNNKV